MYGTRSLGAVFVALGNTGDGRIELTAYDTPRISVLTQGATYNAQTEYVLIGDLNGMPGITGPTMGIYIGDASNYLKYDGSALTIAGNGSGLTSINGSNITTGTINASLVAVTNLNAANITTGDLAAARIQTNVLSALQANATALSAIRANLGTITAGTIMGGTIRTAVSGARVELNTTQIFGTDGTTIQWYANASDGKLYAGGGKVVLSANGIDIGFSFWHHQGRIECRQSISGCGYG